MKKLFILGVTGYVAGTIIEKWIAKNSNVEISALVRSQSRADLVTSKYPNIRIIIGDLDSHDIIVAECAKADIVLSSADCDHEGHIKSIYEGMKQHNGTSFLIHTSGTGTLTDPALAKSGEESQSELSDRFYDDIEDIKLITNLPDENLHRSVDRLVLETAPPNVKQLIVCPPLIYGKGTGPANQNSIQTPPLISAILERGRAFTVTEGKGHWSNVHVEDLADFYIILLDETIKGGEKLTWGSEGYYFCVGGEHDWIDLSKEIAKIAKEKGLITSDKVDHLSKEEIRAINKNGVYSWGTNSKSKSSRARQLGWKPSRPGFFQTLAREVDDAVERQNS